MIKEVGARLLERHERLAASMVAKMVDEIAEYRRAPEDVLEDVLTLATANAELLARTFAAGERLQREDVPIVRDQAARRVHQGISLEVFLRAYRVALFAFWDEAVAEAERLGASRSEGLEVARLALDAIDTMTTHAAEAYLREETRVRTRSGREARDLVERLLRGDRVDPRAVPGLDLGAKLVVAVGREADADALARRGRLVAVREGEVVLIAAALPELPGRFGVGLPAHGAAAVPRAYREAALALSYATEALPVIALADLSALEIALLGADETTRALIASRGERLAPDDRELVRAFARNDLNVARAAAALHVHPNTVRYRLQRISAATGHDPRTFSGLVELVCALSHAV